MPVSYTDIPRPSVPTYDEIGEAFNLLLINATDFLLINASDDKLAISESGYDLYTEVAKPSAPSYTEITRPS